MRKTSLKKQPVWVPFAQLKREMLRDKAIRLAYEADRIEHEIISALIRKRIQKKLSQAQVAKKAKMHQSAIARLEGGRFSPTIETVSRVANALDVHVTFS